MTNNTNTYPNATAALGGTNNPTINGAPPMGPEGLRRAAEEAASRNSTNRRQEGGYGYRTVPSLNSLYFG